MRRRVVITGMGWVTPLGAEIDTVWRRLLAGESGVGPTTLFDAKNFPTKIAAEVRDAELPPQSGDDDLSKHLARHTRFAIHAARDAMSQAGLDNAPPDPTRFGVYLGAGEGQQDFFCFSRMMTSALADGGLDVARFTKTGLELLNPLEELEQEPNMPSGHLAALFDAQGPNVNCLTACAASSQAVGEASEIIRRGDAEVMISGGAHSMIHPFGVTGFNLLGALSTRNDEPARASRPFDRLRDGFVLGEGAGIVILEELEHAKARGAPIHAELVGYGSTADAFRVTDTHPEGRGASSCLNMALADAGLAPEEIHYINAHGTSTSVNDRVETLAVKRVFGDHAKSLPVSSTKSMMGHLIAAAGVAELIVCMLALRDNAVPPTINYEEPDPDCDLDYVPNEAREVNCTSVASNSFGFGGQNIALVVSQFAA